MNSERKNPRRDHERTDWNLNYVLWGGITLVIAVAIILAGSWRIFRNFQKSAESRVLGTALAQPILPPEPRLQISPSADWAEMLARERAILHSYGWVDRSRGIVHMPIEREIEMIAQRGLPTPKSEGGNTK